MDVRIQSFRNDAGETVAHLQEDLKSIRTGRATPALIENLQVEAYGGQSTMRLREIASITTDGPTMLVVVPFDPSVTPDIEKAILKSPLGVSPRTQGTRTMVMVPPMSQEQRDKMIKAVGQMVEEKRVIIRNKRDEVRKGIKHDFEAKTITEDYKFRVEKELDEEAKKQMEIIDDIKHHKEAEIRQI